MHRLERLIVPSVHGIRFSQEFDALPPHFEKLEIQVIGFQADYDVQQSIDIPKGLKDEAIEIRDQDSMLKEVKESAGDTYLTISSYNCLSSG